MINHNEKVSILISIYNGEPYIKKSLKSILEQSYKNIEVLIIDDGSTDQTFKICKSYQDKDSRIKLFRNETNAGLTKSLNILLENTTTKYIARHDIDDISNKDRIEKQYRHLRENKLDMVYARATIKNSKKIIPRFSYYAPLKVIVKFKNPFIHGTMFSKKEVLENINNYDERFVYSQDYKLITDILGNGNKVQIMKNVLYNLNMENNISTKHKKEQKYFADCVRKNLVP
jgi:glycosyltransferase involved in cell wall biosynthesis